MITITPAQLEHARTIAEIAEEMDRFYGATEVEPQKPGLGRSAKRFSATLRLLTRSWHGMTGC